LNVGKCIGGFVKTNLNGRFARTAGEICTYKLGGEYCVP